MPGLAIQRGTGFQKCERKDGKSAIFVKSGVQPKPAPVLTSVMTLRDHFAGLALNAVLNNGWNADAVAEECYRIADAMMKEREKL